MTKGDHVAALRDHLGRVRHLVRSCETVRGLVHADRSRELRALEGELDVIAADLAAQIDDLMAGRYTRHLTHAGIVMAQDGLSGYRRPQHRGAR